MPRRPLVLLSNDDGFESPGLAALRDALLPDMVVVVVAPEREQSASSHALSLRSPLRLHRVSKGFFYLTGRPADCVYVALSAGKAVLPRKPDLVLSGINRGPNLGLQDSFYSGTVAAAREGAMRGVPAIAVSAHPSLDLSLVAAAAARVASSLLKQHRGRRVPLLLNLNFPPRWGGELRVTRLGERVYDEMVDFRVDPAGRDYLWLGGPGFRHGKDDGTDTAAYDARVASVTPLTLDLTSAADLDLTSCIAQDVQTALKRKARPR